MSYFPKHYIIPNQYTSGGEFLYASSGIEYIGWYWSTGNGRYYTGQTPQNPNPQELIQNPGVGNELDFNEQPLYTNKIKIALEGDAPEVGNGDLPYNSSNVIKYATSKNIPISPNGIKILPQYNPTLPSSQNYQIGEFRRYFCKKTNEIQYIEINQETFTQLQQKSPAFEWTLYFPFFINWQLTGDKQQVAHVNKNIVLYEMKRFSLPKFNLYLKEDYTKYYQ